MITATQPFIVAAIDGCDIAGGSMLSNTYIDVPAGGRVDLLVTVSSENVRVGLLSGPSLVIGPDGSGGAPDLSGSS